MQRPPHRPIRQSLRDAADERKLQGVLRRQHFSGVCPEKPLLWTIYGIKAPRTTFWETALIPAPRLCTHGEVEAPRARSGRVRPSWESRLNLAPGLCPFGCAPRSLGSQCRSGVSGKSCGAWGWAPLPAMTLCEAGLGPLHQHSRGVTAAGDWF